MSDPSASDAEFDFSFKKSEQPGPGVTPQNNETRTVEDPVPPDNRTLVRYHSLAFYS